MKFIAIFGLFLTLFSCKARSSSGTKNEETGEGGASPIPARFVSSKNGLSAGETESGAATLGGIATKDGWVQLLADDGLNVVRNINKGAVAIDIVEGFKEAIDPGQFDLTISNNGDTAQATVFTNLQSLRAKKDAAEKLLKWSQQPGEHDGLQVVATALQPPPEFDRAVAITWVINDGRPQPATGYVLDDGTVYVALPEFTGTTWLGGNLSQAN